MSRSRGRGAALLAWITVLAGCASPPVAADAGGATIDSGLDIQVVDSEVPDRGLADVGADLPVVWQRGTTFNPDRVLPPRLVAPLSGWNVNTQRPTLKWVLPPELSLARVELCRDRACTMELRRYEVPGNRYRIDRPLVPGVVFWRVRGLDQIGQVRWTSATWEMGIPYRDNGGDYITGPLRDFDGDGLDDVAMKLETEHSTESLSVAVEVLFGGRTSGEFQQVQLRPPDADSFGMRLGWSDLDGDGRSELLIGSPGSGIDKMYMPSVWAASGTRVSPNIRLLARRPSGLPGGAFGADFSACDVDGDGLPEVMILDFPPGEILTRRSEQSAFARSWSDDRDARLGGVKCVGDVNGDGFGDVAQVISPVVNGVPSVYNWIALVPGGPDGLSSAQIVELTLPIDSGGGFQFFGSSIQAVGDFDQDGFNDFAVTSSNAAHVFFGDRHARVDRRIQRLNAMYRSGPGPQYGAALTSGDYDGNGAPEIVVSAPCSPSDHQCGVGELFVFAWSSRDTPIIGELVEQGRDVLRGRFGSGLSSGDLNGDGYADMVVVEQFSRTLYVRLGGAEGLRMPDRQSLPISGGQNGTVQYGYFIAVRPGCDEWRSS